MRYVSLILIQCALVFCLFCKYLFVWYKTRKWSAARHNQLNLLRGIKASKTNNNENENKQNQTNTHARSVELALIQPMQSCILPRLITFIWRLYDVTSNILHFSYNNSHYLAQPCPINLSKTTWYIKNYIYCNQIRLTLHREGFWSCEYLSLLIWSLFSGLFRLRPILEYMYMYCSAVRSPCVQGVKDVDCIEKIH